LTLLLLLSWQLEYPALRWKTHSEQLCPDATSVEAIASKGSPTDEAAEPYVPRQTSATVMSTTYDPTPLEQLAEKRTSQAAPHTTADVITVDGRSPIASFEQITTDDPGPASCSEALIISRNSPLKIRSSPRRQGSRSPRRRRTPSHHVSPRGRWVSERDYTYLQRHKVTGNRRR